MISLAQDQAAERFLEVRGKSELELKPLPRATADLYEVTAKVNTIQTGADGSFSFRLETNKEYTIEVLKDGLVSKSIRFNTSMPDEEKGTWISEFSIGLIKACDGVDYSALKEPVDIVKFDPKRREFVSDKDYVNKMRPRLESILMKYDQCMMDKYDAAIKKGDQAFTQNKMEEAQAAYQEALEIYPRETYPTRQINEIRNQEDKQQKSADQSERKQQESIDDKFNQALAKASVAYTRKEYATARQYYQEALGIKPAESLPKARMQEIEDILARKAAEDARIKEENEKRAAAEREYQSLLTQADNQYKAKSYDEAKASYSKAMAMRPSDPYPVQRVKLVENTMTAEKQKTMELQVTKQYQDIIAVADQFLLTKDLGKAREAYSQALSIKPGDQYAQSRISGIDNSVAAEQAAKIKAAEEGYKAAIGAANTALAQKLYPQARDFLQKALTIKPGDPYAMSKTAELDHMIEEQRKAQEQQEILRNKYREAVTEADKLFNAGNLPDAKVAYNAILQFKPGDNYAIQKITAIENLIAAQVANKQQQSESAYSNAMTTGTQFLAGKEFIKARESFQQALTIKPGDISATAKLRDTELQIAQEQERIAAEQARKRNYDESITRADQFFTQKNYTSARQAYEEALNTMPGEVYPRQRLDEIATISHEQEKLLAQKQATENAYSLALGNADKYFKAKDYVMAKEEYARAISLKPREEYPKTRLAEIENLLMTLQQEQAAAKARADAYAAAINMGNVQFSGKDYAAARISYSEALKQLPDDKLAREQIEKIDYILSEQEKQKQAETARKASYDALITSGDNAYNTGNYSVARENYRKALGIEPGSAYAKQRIAHIDEINQALSQAGSSAAAASASRSKVTAAIPMGELVFRTESDKQKYLDELKKKYPAGITLEKYQEKYKETFRFIVIREDQAQEFRQIRFLTYNGVEYSFNGKPITQQFFLSQVKVRQGESFQEISMQ
jgi:tetratricopeptide (TPR) repeat protein